MASYISPKESVVDLGCGKMWLKECLKDNVYYPVDYTRRDAQTCVADFNKHEYPPTRSDVAFVSGALEYVVDYEWFVRQITQSSTKCILSYCTTEAYPDIKERERRAWKNHLTRAEIIDLFTRNGMELKCENGNIQGNRIFVFISKGRKDEIGREAQSVPMQNRETGNRKTNGSR